MQINNRRLFDRLLRKILIWKQSWQLVIPSFFLPHERLAAKVNSTTTPHLAQNCFCNVSRLLYKTRAHWKISKYATPVDWDNSCYLSGFLRKKYTKFFKKWMINMENPWIKWKSCIIGKNLVWHLRPIRVISKHLAINPESLQEQHTEYSYFCQISLRTSIYSSDPDWDKSRRAKQANSSLM